MHNTHRTWLDFKKETRLQYFQFSWKTCRASVRTAASTSFALLAKLFLAYLQLTRKSLSQSIREFVIKNEPRGCSLNIS